MPEKSSLEQAREHAAEGRAVTPCWATTGAPYAGTYATTDLEKIEEWFGKKWPSAKVRVASGNGHAISQAEPETFFGSIAIPLAKGRGWKVAPCLPRDKTVHGGLVPRPLEQMSDDPDRIRAWGKREPNANVCVYAQQIEGGLCFLDKDGAKDIREAYRAETGNDFRTLFVRSSIQNGVEKGHWYFVQTAKTRALAGNISEAATDGWFSFRVKNEYVCTIGSIHPVTGKPYEVKDDCPIAPMPDDLLDWLQAQTKRKNETRKVEGDAAPGKLPKGTRYTALISEVGSLWHRGWRRALAIDAGIKWARDNFDLDGEAFDERLVRKEIEHLLDSYPQGDVAQPRRANLLAQKFSDYGNAERLIALYGDDLRYCHQMRKWLAWDSCHWKIDEGERARDRAQKTALEFIRQAIEEVKNAASGDDNERKAFAASSKSFSLSCLNTTRLSNMLREAQPALAVYPSDLDANPWLLNFQNGTFDLYEGVFRREHRKADLVTKMLHFDYDPAAKAPLFEDFVKHTFGDLSDFVKKAAGYSSTGVTSEKVVFLCTGPTDTGKSTFLALMRDLLDEYATLIQVDTLMASKRNEDANAKADLADLRGARLAITSETEEGHRLKEGQIKRITQGQGKIKSTRKYENPIEFSETHKLWIDTNFKPVLRGNDDSTWNRLVPIPCENRLAEPEIDRELPAKLRKEAVGILAWIVEGALLYRKEGLGRPDAVKKSRDEWREDMNQLAEFIEQCCAVPGDKLDCEVKSAKFEVKADELFKRYIQWCEDRRENEPMDRKTFSNRMRDEKYVVTKPKGKGRIYHGIRLLALGETKAEEESDDGTQVPG